MNAMQAKYGEDDLVIIAVNVDATRADAESFLRDYPAEFTVVFDPDGHLAQQYDVIAMPCTYVFDRAGNLVARHLGFKVKRQDEYEALLVETLSR
jgi:peroxiredoxin